MSAYDPNEPPPFSGAGDPSGDRPSGFGEPPRDFGDPPGGSFGGGGFDAPPPQPLRDGPAWEHRDRLNGMRAAALTVREVLLEPSETFSRARRVGGLGAPMLYAFLMTIIFGCVGLFYGEVMSRISGEMFAALPADALGDTYSELQQQLAAGSWGPGISLVVLMISAVAAPLLSALLYHVTLMIFGGTRAGFEATYRVAAYCVGSTAVLQIVPLCGAWIGGLWYFVVLIIGLARIHETETWRAVAAVLVPLVTCACLFLAFFVAFAGLLLGAAQ